jgi:hypothetical protein
MPKELLEDGRSNDVVKDPFTAELSPDTLSSLEEIRNQILGESPQEGDAPQNTDDIPPTTVDPTNSPTEDAPPKTDDAPPKTDDAAPKTDDAAPKTDDAAPKADDAAPKTDDAAPKTDDAAPKADDDFSKRLDAIEIPPHARPKSSEAFALVKETARKEVERLSAELAAEKTARQAAEEKAKTSIPSEEVEQLRAQVADLGKLKAERDIETDPRITEFDTRIKECEDAILGKFMEYGGTKEQIEQIQKAGGPKKIDWEPLFKHMTLPQRRFIESKLVEAEGVAYNRSEAVKRAKSDVETWRKEYDGRRFKHADAELKKVEWLQTLEPKTDATPEQKTQIVEHNKRVATLNQRVKAALADTSPEMHATLAVGTAMAHELQWQLNTLSAFHEKKVKELTESNAAALKTIETERNQLKAELDKIKKSASGAPNKSVASGRADAKLPKKEMDLSKTTGDSLDSLRDEVMAGRSPTL